MKITAERETYCSSQLLLFLFDSPHAAKEKHLPQWLQFSLFVLISTTFFSCLTLLGRCFISLKWKKRRQKKKLSRRLLFFYVLFTFPFASCLAFVGRKKALDDAKKTNTFTLSLTELNDKWKCIRWACKERK